MKTYLLLVLLLLLLLQLTEKLVIRAEAATAESSAMPQFLEQRNGQHDDSSEWIFLPSNYYSELNEQYYTRFRRQSKLEFKDLHEIRPYPFEIALYSQN